MENKKKKGQKKIVFIILAIVIVLLAGCGAFLYFYVKQNKNIEFKLKGSDDITISLLEEYFDDGYVLKVNNKDSKASISSDIINTKVGTYKITYKFVDKFKLNHVLVRTVNVVDSTSPDIVLKGNKEITLLVGEEYKEDGYEVVDNYDKKEDINVEITNNIDTSKVGTYTVTYKAVDKFGNTTYAFRTVNVNAPKKAVIYVEPKVVEKTTVVANIVVNTDNTITKNKFTNTGIYYEGYSNSGSESNIIYLKNETNTYEFPMSTTGNYFKGDISFDNVENGTYKLFINSDPLKNKLEVVEKIVRAKVGNKLITMNYDDGVSLTVEDFGYAYDVLIDVGHGGYDTGAANAYMYEKNMNLIQSRYEKCRYEEMGLNVLMVRNDDTYGNMMGPSNYQDLTRRAYYMGYYGVVSKITYSNHHNSAPNKKAKGFEILTPAQVDSLENEIAIKNALDSYYPYQGRMYTRDYNTGGIYTTNNGETYAFKNYYCVIRVPYELFNQKVVIYEGAYLSNLEDFNWYWTDGNWKGASEIKIKQYVTSLGVAYIENTTCN